MEINIDRSGGQLLTSRTSITRLNTLLMDQADRDLPFAVWLLDRTGSESAPLTPMALPAPYTQLIVIVRNKANVATGDPLVEVTTFASAGAGAALHYQAALTVDTAAVAAQFPDSNPTKLTLDALLDVVLSTDDALTQEVIVRQQACTIFRRLYQGTEGTVASVPAYPLPGALALAARTLTGAGSITGGGDLTANRSLQLAGDSATPGAAMYYGTDGGGAKGFHALPAGGLADAPSDGTRTPA